MRVNAALQIGTQLVLHGGGQPMVVVLAGVPGSGPHGERPISRADRQPQHPLRLAWSGPFTILASQQCDYGRVPHLGALTGWHDRSSLFWPERVAPIHTRIPRSRAPVG
jgi:hypothetical protein